MAVVDSLAGKISEELEIKLFALKGVAGGPAGIRYGSQLIEKCDFVRILPQTVLFETPYTTMKW